MAVDSSNARRFVIALSFPGEQRKFMEQVAGHLATTFTKEWILYDKFHDAEFARLDLDIYLPALYWKESELIVIFLCPEYREKRWCGLEWRYIRQLIQTPDAQRIMFLSFGNPGDLSDLGFLTGDGYIDVLPLTPQTVAEKILKRLRFNQGITPIETPQAADRAAPVCADISRAPRANDRPPNPPTGTPEVVAIWKERLTFFQIEEAKATTAAEKFNLFKEIEAAKAKIREYGGSA